MYGDENASTATGRNCEDCEFAIMQEVGYSNWTVEGTNFYCAKRLHPSDGFDRFYGRDKRLDFAAQCVGYRHGHPVGLDVDGENDLSENDQDILKMRGPLERSYDSWRWYATDV